MAWDPPDTWKKMGAFLSDVGKSVGEAPKAVLVISGHWEETEFTVTGSARPSLIYDYSGFPPETYQLKYNAPGSPELAERVVALLNDAGIAAGIDPQRGFDHGVFIPFKLVYPEANVPIVQMSLKGGLDPAAHLAAGRALGKLRDEGVLIVGSGMSYHNLRTFFAGGANPTSDRFDAWLTDAVTNEDREHRLLSWRTAPSARDAHPREEHLIPIMVAAGAAEADAGQRIYSDRVMGAAISAYRFG
jgi:aromatic ring-opening dioxygenase catalytic subunit (LigB family)